VTKWCGTTDRSALKETILEGNGFDLNETLTLGREATRGVFNEGMVHPPQEKREQLKRKSAWGSAAPSAKLTSRDKEGEGREKNRQQNAAKKPG